MNLRESIEQLANFVDQVKLAVFADDKTPLKNALALRDEAILIDSGQSEFDVVIFGDINRFKGLNDQYGHDAGDVAIGKVGEQIHQTIVERFQTKTFRQSGDEFVILLKRNLTEEFLQESKKFGEMLFTYEGKSLKTAMSFGYAVSDGKSSFSQLAERAETACQTAKNQGDGVCIAWSKKLQREALVNLRQRCQKCGAKTSCNVPKKNAPVKLLSCPCCGQSF